MERVEEAKSMQILTDIIEFSVQDDKIHQDDGFRQPVPDGWLKPLTFSHDDVASVRTSKR
jgi:hypothetical protein